MPLGSCSACSAWSTQSLFHGLGRALGSVNTKHDTGAGNSAQAFWLTVFLRCGLSRNGASTVVTAIFGGILQNEVNCLICGTESRKFDPFLGKVLPLVFQILCDLEQKIKSQA